MKPALLILDMQEIFFEHSPEVAQSLTSAVEDIHELLSYDALVKLLELI